MSDFSYHDHCMHPPTDCAEGSNTCRWPFGSWTALISSELELYEEVNLMVSKQNLRNSLLRTWENNGISLSSSRDSGFFYRPHTPHITHQLSDVNQFWSWFPHARSALIVLHQIQGQWCNFTCFVDQDNPWKPDSSAVSWATYTDSEKVLDHLLQRFWSSATLQRHIY